MDFEGVGRVAMLADAQGAVFAVFREARNSRLLETYRNPVQLSYGD